MEGEYTGKSKDQRDLVRSIDWDLLVILDDYRYDYFERNYQAYLKGGKCLAIPFEGPAF